MTVTPLHPKAAEEPRRDRFADHASGLIYLDRLGPELPTLNARGLGYVRDDLLARAAGADAQAKANPENFTLVTICETTARTCREVAAQIVTYSLTPTWMVTE
jgi:hypothetical protein